MRVWQVMYNVVHEHLRLKAPSGMPPAYAAIMEACWDEEPEKRCIVGQQLVCYVMWTLCGGLGVAPFSALQHGAT